MAFTTGTLGTAATTSLTKAIVWGAQPGSIYGTAAGLTAANYQANYVPCLADLNAAMQDFWTEVYPQNDTGIDIAEIGNASTAYEYATITNGILYWPGGRGQFRLRPYDVIGVDTNTGWPIVINNATALSNKWHVVPNI